MERGWQESDVFGKSPYSERDAWAWLVGAAEWEKNSKPTPIDGKPTILKRGELSHSLRFMAEKFGWSKDKVSRFIKKLVLWKMLKIETANETAQNVITICNYSKYQDNTKRKETVTAIVPRQHRDKDKESIKKEEEKKDSNGKDKNYAFEGKIIRLLQDDFEVFRQNCPKLSETEYLVALGNADMAYYHGDSNNWFFRLAAYLRKEEPNKVKDGSAWFMG